MPSMKSDGETNALSSAHASVRVRAAWLEVVSGPDTGRRARVDRPVFVVGKGEGCDLRLTDGTVSREHLRLALSPIGIVVTDGGSKNGTLCGALRIERITLVADATLILGATTLAVRLDTGETELEVSAREQFGGAFGVSPAMRNVFALLERAAPSDAPVLIEGESGVGKEVLVRAVHSESRRREGPFVAIDCGAIPASLIESELFGHERGAFTGADRARDGVFQQAHGGTLFLDEIGELPVDLQPKLLRALETGEVRPVGGRPHSVDVRVLAATNRRLGEAVHRGEFRIDLFYRLAVLRVVVPPLRDRREDIVPLALSFLRRTTRDPKSELPPDFAALLSSYAWPGNVRELRNVIDRYALFGAANPKQLFDTQAGPIARIGGASSTSTAALDAELFDSPFHEAKQELLERFERAYLTHALAATGGIVTKAVERTGIARPTIYRMMNRLGMGKTSDDDTT
ncbi:sigma 54-interacting transcriptional regulator [Pendulispora albinea]|uniref:Sigma 54-interacting transcriptional regulator n=1 Tax=Pendulispora albinea TaxID=2741071 RepID=A0ABZ2LK89_9BACT